MARRRPKDPHASRVVRAADEGIATDGEKWLAVCDKHGTFVAVRTKKDAKSSTTTDFCDDCRDLEG